MKIPVIKTNGDNLYQIIHQEPENKQIDIDFIKNKHNCTNVFRKDGLYWFVRLIEEAELIEEEIIPTEEEKTDQINLNLEN
jgi:hypothetical protein